MNRDLEMAPATFDAQPPAASPVSVPSSVYDRVTNPIEFVATMGEKLAKSGFAGCSKIEQGEMIILECMARKMSPFEFSSTYHIVQNKLTMRSDAMLARAMKLGVKVRWKQFDDKAAIADFIVDGHSTEIGYTIKDAARAGLANRAGSWKTHTPEMLRARLISKAIRMVMPEAIHGIYTPEEIQESVPVSKPQESLFNKTNNDTKNETARE